METNIQTKHHYLLSKIAGHKKMHKAILCFIMLFMFLTLSSCNEANETFYIYNLSIDIGPYATGEFRADNFNPDNSHFQTFLGFGQYINENKMNSCFEWRLDINSHVYAPCDAKIIRLEYQPETNDWSVFIAPKNAKGKYSKNWRIDMDHVTIDPSLNLHDGSLIKVNQVLGTIGPYDSFFKDFGRVELDVINNNVHYAPMLFVHPSVKPSITLKVQSLVSLFSDHYSTMPNAEQFEAGCWRSPYGDGTYIPEEYYAQN